MTREERFNKIETLGGFDGGPGPTEKYKALIYTSLIEDLEDSINKNSTQNSKLTRAIIFLNIVIAAATLALAGIGGTDLWFRYIATADTVPQVSTQLCK